MRFRLSTITPIEHVRRPSDIITTHPKEVAGMIHNTILADPLGNGGNFDSTILWNWAARVLRSSGDIGDERLRRELPLVANLTSGIVLVLSEINESWNSNQRPP